MKIISCLSGWYRCTESGSEQQQWHYLEVKGLSHSHPNLFPEPGEFAIYGILDPREFVERLPRLQENLSKQEKTLLNTTSERVLKKENSISISREGVEHRIICSFTDREAKVGFLYFITLLIGEYFLRFGGQDSTREGLSPKAQI